MLEDALLAGVKKAFLDSFLIFLAWSFLFGLVIAVIHFLEFLDSQCRKDEDEP